MKRVKGFEAGRKNLIKLAKTATLKAGAHAYRDRRVKKRDMRALWNIRINAAARAHGLTYSQFISALKNKNIKLDRKVMSQIVEIYPNIFEQIVAATK